MDSNYTPNFLNMKELGAAGNGIHDDSLAVQTAFDRVKSGETVYFPAGKYLITRTISISRDRINIIGDGRDSQLIFTYEQRDSDTASTASLFSFSEGIGGIMVKDLKLEYTGCFYPNVGESYNGKVNGLNFVQCFDVSIENIEVSGFNASGVCVITGSPDKYAKRFKVDKCYLHHNRVAGFAFGYVEQVSLTNCDLEYQGSVLDGGTGYGCAGSSSELPRFIQISGNRAMYNYRKGIDLHAGINAVIEGNICHGNRLYGIYAEGPKTGNIVIRGNIISGMERNSVGIPPPYTWINGIDIGCYSESPNEADYFNYIIEGNLIYDFGLGDGSANPLNIYPDFMKGTIQIKNNTFRTGRITRFLGFSPAAQYECRDIKIDISGNQVFIDECTENIMDIPCCRHININGNQFTVKQACKPDEVVNIGENCSFVTCTNNHVELSDSPERLKLLSVNKNEGEIRIARNGNILNGSLEE